MPLVARLRPTQKLGSSQTVNKKLNNKANYNTFISFSLLKLRNKKTIMTMSEFLEFKNRVIA